LLPAALLCPIDPSGELVALSISLPQLDMIGKWKEKRRAKGVNASN